MKKAMILALTALMICGCGQNTEMKKETSVTAASTAREADSETSVAETTASETAASTFSTAENAENEILLLWKNDITLQDPFVPTQDLGAFGFKEITVPSQEADAIGITVDTAELKSDKIDADTGSVNAEYAVVRIEEEADENHQKVWKDLKTFDQFAEQNAILEISDGEIRHEAYRRQLKESSPLHLHSYTGIELMRADSGILSYLRTVYRPNLGYEPDYYEIYGRTIDADSGRVLTLNDILTDTGDLPRMIWDSLVRNGYRQDTDPDRNDFMQILQTAIQGIREDGSFGWAESPEGLEFGLIETREDGGYETHVRENAFLPFRTLEDILRPGIGVPAYDHKVQVTASDAEAATGYSIPSADGNISYKVFYIIQKNGVQYLCCASDDRGDLYEITGDGLKKSEESADEIMEGLN